MQNAHRRKDKSPPYAHSSNAYISSMQHSSEEVDEEEVKRRRRKMEINCFMVLRRALKLLWNYDMNSFVQFNVFRGKIDVNAISVLRLKQERDRTTVEL